MDNPNKEDDLNMKRQFINLIKIDDMPHEFAFKYINFLPLKADFINSSRNTIKRIEGIFSRRSFDVLQNFKKILFL